MQKADITSRLVAAFIDLLVVIGLSMLPDILGFLSASGYILLRDGIFSGMSIGKRLAGIRVVSGSGPTGFKDSLSRNFTFEIAYILFHIPYLGWLLGPVVIVAESLTALGDENNCRVGDIIAGTRVVRDHVEKPAEKEATGTEARVQARAGPDTSERES